MGFSVPAISCMLSLPSNTSLFYLKMINGVAVNIHQPAAAPLHHCNELCGLVFPPCVTGCSAFCCCSTTSWMTRTRLHGAAGPDAAAAPFSLTFSLVLQGREASQHEIILYPTGQQHAAAVSKLISNYPQILWVSHHVKESERNWADIMLSIGSLHTSQCYCFGK